MTQEQKWISEKVIRNLNVFLKKLNTQEVKYIAVDGYKLPYAFEIFDYNIEKEITTVNHDNSLKYETDILIWETNEQKKTTKPRIIIEGKLKTISTHAAITYSNKAKAHKTVHPYLRYGIIIGDNKSDSIPGRLFRHGENFDFMLCWDGLYPKGECRNNFHDLIDKEIKASQDFEEFILNTRKSNRKKYNYLHKELILK